MYIKRADYTVYKSCFQERVIVDSSQYKGKVIILSAAQTAKLVPFIVVFHELLHLTSNCGRKLLF